MPGKKKEYSNESISQLKGADRVRLRPAVIFGSDGIEGCEHAMFEILSNSIDEAREGHGDLIEITRYLDKSIEVTDYGRGVPVDYNPVEDRYNWELVFCELCMTRLKNAYGYESCDIQVLSPVKKGITGVNNMNILLQGLLNPPSKGKKEKIFGDMILRVGDRVMQTRNNYDMLWREFGTGVEGFGVFNGDVGVVHDINNDLKTVSVTFDDKEVVYDFKEVSDLSLAYCITVHKSQGSEFPVVVMPLYPGPDMIMNRNLFYTGVTRAKNLVILVGNRNVMCKMVDNNRVDKRYSGLTEKICNEFS